MTTVSRRRSATLRKPQAVLDAITGVLRPLAETSPDAAMPTDVRDLVDAMLAPSEDPWVDAKKSGVQAFAGDEHSSLTTLMSKLDGRGIVLVQVGELERFAPNLAKNKAWLPNAIEANAHTRSGPQELIGRIMQFHSQALM